MNRWRMYLLSTVLIVAYSCTQKRDATAPDKQTSYPRARWGFVRHDGKAIPCIFDREATFWNGYACVQYRGKWGIIDTTGRFVIPPEYERVDAIRHGITRVWKKEEGDSVSKAVFMDTTGRRVAEPWWWRLKWYYMGYPERLHPMPDSATKVSLDKFSAWSDSVRWAVMRRGGDPLPLPRMPLPTDRYGYVDSTEQFVIPPMYVRAENFRDGLAWVALDTGRAPMFCIDSTGRFVTPPHDYWYSAPFHCGLAAFQSGDKCGYRNEQGDVVIWPQFDNCDEFHEGLAVIAMNDSYGREKYGVIDTAGTWIAAPLYDQADWAFGGLVAVCLRQ